MKQKTLYGIRYVNKKIIKKGLLSFVVKCQKKKTNNSKIVAFFSKLHETKQALGM